MLSVQYNVGTTLNTSNMYSKSIVGSKWKRILKVTAVTLAVERSGQALCAESCSIVHTPGGRADLFGSHYDVRCQNTAFFLELVL